MVKIAIYIRIRKEDALVIECQKQYFNELIKSKNNCEIVEFYIDVSKYERTENLPEYNRMIKDAETHKFDYIIIKGFRQFGCLTSQKIEMIQKLKEKGIGVYSIAEGMDTLSSGWSSFMMELYLSMENELKRIRK
jgi:DNA invertase Pin-like site-specific DNA recombinase